MSSLLPNVDDLIKALPDSKHADDARMLAAAAATAHSAEELDNALDAVIKGWLA